MLSILYLRTYAMLINVIPAFSRRERDKYLAMMMGQAKIHRIKEGSIRDIEAPVIILSMVNYCIVFAK